VSWQSLYPLCIYYEFGGCLLAEDKKVRDLLLKASRDLDFREEFLNNPTAVGKRYGVEFSAEALARIDKTRKTIDMIREIIMTSPIPKYRYYPVGPILRHWEIEELWRFRKPIPVGYPAQFMHGQYYYY
jgi:hypothetical protein